MALSLGLLLWGMMLQQSPVAEGRQLAPGAAGAEADPAAARPDPAAVGACRGPPGWAWSWPWLGRWSLLLTPGQLLRRLADQVLP